MTLRDLRVCWMLSSAGEARLAVPAAAAMAEQGIRSVFTTWLTECARFLHDFGPKDAVYVPRALPASAPLGVDELEALDRRYPVPGLAALAYAEMRARFLEDRDAVLPLVVRYLIFWERFLAEQRIDAAVIWTSSNVPCRSLWSVARARGLPSLVIGSGPTYDHFSLADVGEETVWSELLETLKTPPAGRRLEGAAREEVLRLVQQVGERHASFKPRPTTLLPADWFGRLKRSRAGRAAGATLRALRLRRPSARQWPSLEAMAAFPDDAEESALLHRLSLYLDRRRSGWAWLTRTGLLRYDEADFDRPYVCFPMQQEVGARLAGHAPPYSDQIGLAEWIALMLPPGVRLYVKEHPTHPGVYDWRRLRRLQGLSNVAVVHPHTDNGRLLRKARAVVVVSSTAGWEAFLARIPVVALGRTYYSCSDLVFSVGGLNELPAKLRAALDAGAALYARREEEWLWFIYQTMATAHVGSPFGYKRLFEVLQPKDRDANGRLIGRGLASKIRRACARDGAA
jgi:hypothetical protein